MWELQIKPILKNMIFSEIKFRLFNSTKLEIGISMAIEKNTISPLRCWILSDIQPMEGEPINMPKYIIDTI